MKVIPILSAVALACVSAASLACDLPALVSIPDKEKVAGHEKEIQDAVAAYMTAMQTYTDCVKKELADAGGDDAPTQVRTLLVQRNNAAVAEADVVMKWFKQNVGDAAAVSAQGRGQNHR